MFDQGHVEIDEQAKTLAGQAKMRQELLFVDRGDDLNRFDFDDYEILDDEVRTKADLDAGAVIDDRDGLLPGNVQAATLQLEREDGFVDGLQEAGTEGRVHAVGGIYDVPREFVFGHNR